MHLKNLLIYLSYRFSGHGQKFQKTTKTHQNSFLSIQGVHGALSVQTTQGSATLDGFQSSVNVLQVSAPQEPPSPTGNEPGHASFGSSGFASDSSSHASSGANREAHGGKHGRPILGWYHVEMDLSFDTSFFWVFDGKDIEIWVIVKFMVIVNIAKIDFILFQIS